MIDSTLITILTGTGVSGVFCLLFIFSLIYPKSVVTDKDKVIAELKQAIQAERDRADTAVAAASVTKEILTAMQFGQPQRRGPDLP